MCSFKNVYNLKFELIILCNNTSDKLGAWLNFQCHQNKFRSERI